MKTVKKKTVKNITVPDESFTIAKSALSEGCTIREAADRVLQYRRECKLPIKADTVYAIVDNAKKQLNGDYGQDKSQVVPLHVARYNRDILAILEMPNPFVAVPGEEVREETAEEIATKQKMKHMLISQYFRALTAMLAKEKLLQLHSKGFQIHINNRIHVKGDEKKVYDFSKLAFDEQVDFMHLVIKCKKTDSEISTVILRKPEIVTSEYEEAEVVTEEIPNISLIATVEEQAEEVPQKGMGMIDVSLKLAAELKKRAQKDLDKAKGIFPNE